MKSNTDNVWQQIGGAFRPSSTSTDTKILPPGIYSFGHDMMGWFLTKKSEAFIFPYKIYGNNSPIVDRVVTAWDKLDSNLGILLNGIKGTGKTVTAQLIANWAVQQGIPVLVANSPVPLTDILEKVEQPIIIIFDEFEKTHEKNEEQQKLLTAMDGMARNGHKRLFIFTTNSRTIDTNFIDRPSRIRYCWEFNRLPEAVVTELMDDLLEPSLSGFRSAIISYLNTRSILSIDVAKTVINEVNIFRQDPNEFATIMNLTEQEPAAFILELLSSDRKSMGVLSSYLRFDRTHNTLLKTILTKSGSEDYAQIRSGTSRVQTFLGYNENYGFTLLAPTEHQGEWVANVYIPKKKAWVGSLKSIMESQGGDAPIHLDDKPPGWSIPKWAIKLSKGEDLSDTEQTEMENWEDSGTIYGGKPSNLLIRISQNMEARPAHAGYEIHNPSAF